MNIGLNTRKLIAGSAIATAALVTGASTFYRVDLTENAVITTLGGINRVDGPGPHMKWPFVQGATFYPVDNHPIEIIQTRPSCNASTNAADDAGNTTYTKDQQFVYASATAQIALPDGEKLKIIHSRFQNYREMLKNYLSQAMKEVLGRYNTTDIPVARQQIAREIEVALQNQINDKKMPIEVGKGAVQFKNFDFSCQYEAQVESAAESKTVLTRNDTELEIQKVKKQKTIVDAEAEKEKQTLEGEGDAARTLSKARAEAEGIKMMRDALINSPTVVEYEKAQRWNGALPVNMYGSAPVPFLDVAAPGRPAQSGPVAAGRSPTTR